MGSSESKNLGRKMYDVVVWVQESHGKNWTDFVWVFKNQPLFWQKVLIDFFSKVEVLICQKPDFREHLGVLISKSGLEVHYCEHVDWRTVEIVWGVDAELCYKQKEWISNPRKISFVNYTAPPFSTPTPNRQSCHPSNAFGPLPALRLESFATLTFSWVESLFAESRMFLMATC